MESGTPKQTATPILPEITKKNKNGLTDRCATPLSTVPQSYHGDNPNDSCLSLVSPALSWGSKVSCPRILSRKYPEYPVRLEPRTLRVKHFSTEPRRTQIKIVFVCLFGVLSRINSISVI